MTRAPWAFPLIVFLAALAWALRPIWDIDVWWHMALGRHILAHGLPETDVLGVVPMPWRTFQGGYEVFVAWLDGVGGLGLVRLVHALAVAGGMTLLGVTARKVSGSTVVAVAFLCIAVVLYEDRVRVRPHVFNLLFIAALLPVVVEQRRRLWELCWIVPLMALWGAFHGPASLWGLALLGTVAVVKPLDWRGWVQVAAPAGALALVPGVVAGMRGAAQVHTTGRMQELFVPEHWPLRAYLDAGLGAHGVVVPALVVGILLAAAVVSGRALRGLDGEHRHDGALAPRGTSAPESLTLAAAGMGLFSILMARFAWFSLIPLLRTLRGARFGGRTAWTALVLCATLATWDLSTYVLPRWRDVDPWTTDVQPGAFPEAAAEVLARAGIEGRVFPDSQWGGYLLWRLHPGVRVLTDGRIAFPERAGEMLLDFRRSHREAHLDEAHALWGIDLAVMRTPAFAPGRPPARWALLWADPVAEVWARKDAALAGRRQAVAAAFDDR